MTMSSWWVKFLRTATVWIPFSQIFSQFKEYNCCLLSWFFTRVFFFHNLYNYIRSLCLIIHVQFKTEDACSHVRFILIEIQFNVRNMMQFCDIIIKRILAHCSPKLFCGKKLKDFTFFWSHNLQFFAKYYLIYRYTNLKWYQIFWDPLYMYQTNQ